MSLVDGWHATIFCSKYDSMSAVGQTPNRIKDVQTGTKRRLDVKTNNRDSVISGSAGVGNRFGQTCLFANSMKFGTTNSG
jgi:hypothetical protein